MQPCIFCGSPAPLVFVHGHYQCSACGLNALPCCDGDNCGNHFFIAEETAKRTEGVSHLQSREEEGG